MAPDAPPAAGADDAEGPDDPEDAEYGLLWGEYSSGYWSEYGPGFISELTPRFSHGQRHGRGGPPEVRARAYPCEQRERMSKGPLKASGCAGGVAGSQESAPGRQECEDAP